MDSALLPEGVKRCSLPKFLVWTMPWFGLMAWAGVAAFLCLYKGLNQTNMSNVYPFALWIVVDLAVIALGGGAFFTGFLTYVLGKKELKNIINAAVIIGFICYSGAVAMLGIDVGQPLRSWFIFWHSNVHSMLVEVSFCITVYLSVLTIEFIPIILENRKLDEIKEFHIFGHNLHEAMGIFAATGTFLSFFHQGSLGGLYGVMYAVPFAARGGFFIWPWTFFLFILSAISAGPSFTILCSKLTEKISGKKLVPENTYQLLAKIASWLLILYVILKTCDTIAWAVNIVPKAGLSFMDFYKEGPYGVWTVFFELVVCGLIPAVILISPKRRCNEKWLLLGCFLNAAGAVFNRFVFTIITLSIPVMPFERFWSFFPTWQESAVGIAVVAYGVLVFSFSYRYLPVFPKEKELNPA